MKKRVLSGIQASGEIHIGNYFGAIKQQIELQDTHDCYYMIANLHSLTTLRDAAKMRENTFALALDYLALGLDPEKTVLFVQSDIAEHSELAWILSTIAPFGLLERAHAWKDAKSKKLKDPTVGLFTYPVLMAADILLHDAELVPVGRDQKQHVEITRDLALKFNNTYGDTFVLPEASIIKNVAVVPGTDGLKMSKSRGNVISVFANEKVIKKSIMGIQTDSTALEDPMNAETCNVMALYKLMATPQEVQEMTKNYMAGGYGFGRAKKALLEKFLEYFDEYRSKKVDLAKNMDYVEQVLSEGSEKAWNQAQNVMERVKKGTGLDYA